MKLMMTYLKPFSLALVFCLLLLIGQALGELSLPNLMSNMVDVGIQRSGIEEQVPQAISTKGFAWLQCFMDEKDKAILKTAYRKVEPKTLEAKVYAKEYPLLQREAIYLHQGESAPVNQVYTRAAFACMVYAQSLGLGGNGVGRPWDKGLPPPSAPDVSLAITAAKTADAGLKVQRAAGLTRWFYRDLGVDLGAKQQQYIRGLGLKMLGITLLSILAAILVGLLAARIGAKVARQLRHDVFAQVESFAPKEFDSFSLASLITRCTNDVQQIQILIIMGIRMMCYAPIMGLGGLVFALEKSLSLSWIIALAVLVMLGLILLVFQLAVPKFKILQTLIDHLNLISREHLTGLLVIRAFGNESHEEKRFDAANLDLTNTNLYVQRVMSLMMPAMMLVMNLSALLVVWVGGHAIARSTLQIGDMMAFIQYAMQIIMSFLMIAMIFVLLPRASVCAGRIAEVLHTGPSIQDVQEVQPLGAVQGVIAFEHVSFQYDQALAPVLEDISFTAQPGQTTAFIGATGSGKSTLLHLIPRFYDVTQGAIRLDGVDIRDIALEELRQNIAYVPQKGVLFSGDIASNIRLGQEKAKTDKLWAALATAQAKTFVEASPQGLHTEIAQGGDNISGGQKQRLAIARALVKGAPIYLFDDSFSALDYQTDAALRKALRQNLAQATILLVAQRVSTIIEAEQIIVLDEGRIVGQGTHQELLQSCPAYREIAQSQLQEA